MSVADENNDNNEETREPVEPNVRLQVALKIVVVSTTLEVTESLLKMVETMSGASDHTPFYRFELDANDLVIVRPRSAKVELRDDIRIPEWAEEKARSIARDKGWDYYALQTKWLDFARAETGRGNPPENAGAAFVAYCQKQKPLR